MNYSKNLLISTNRFKFLVFILLLICFCQHVYAKPVVRVIYFKPVNVDAPTDEKLNHLRSVIETTEKFYEREMIEHGYGPKTFLTERDKNNKIVITVVNAPKETKEYKDTWHIVVNDIPDDIRFKMETHKSPSEIRIIFIGGLKKFGVGALHKSEPRIKTTFKWCFIPADNNVYLRHFVAHEIGHAFGFDHTPDPGDIMNIPAKSDRATNNLETMSISAEDAKELDRHHHFQHDELSVSPANNVAILWAELKEKKDR